MPAPVSVTVVAEAAVVAAPVPSRSAALAAMQAWTCALVTTVSTSEAAGTGATTMLAEAGVSEKS